MAIRFTEVQDLFIINKWKEDSVNKVIASNAVKSGTIQEEFNKEFGASITVLQRSDYLKRSGVDIESAPFAPFYDILNEFLGIRDIHRPRLMIERNKPIGVIQRESLVNCPLSNMRNTKIINMESSSHQIPLLSEQTPKRRNNSIDNNIDKLIELRKSGTDSLVIIDMANTIREI